MNILGRIYALCLSVYYFFAPYAAPAQNAPIEASAGSRLTFVAWADPQVSDYLLKRDPIYRAACADLANAKTKFDALLIAGDIAENGLACEYDRVTEFLPADRFCNFVMVTGNHDVRMRLYKQTVRRFTGFANALNRACGSGLSIDALHYQYEINGYTFIVLGTDRTEFEEAFLSDAQLQWLDDSLKKAAGKGKPVFVSVHQPFRDSHGLPDTWGSPVPSAGSIGPQSDALKAVLSKYKNIILLSGHLHTGIGQYTYEVIDGIHSVNLPSLTISNKDCRVQENGQGFWVEVFAKKVVFHARIFSEGRDVPQEDFAIPIKQ